MKDPEKFEKILRNVIIAIAGVLITFGCFTYEAFGYEVQDMITLNLPHDNLTSSMQLIYCLGLLGTFPMQIVPTFDISEKASCFVNSRNPFE